MSDRRQGQTTPELRRVLLIVNAEGSPQWWNPLPPEPQEGTSSKRDRGCHWGVWVCMSCVCVCVGGYVVVCVYELVCCLCVCRSEGGGY